LIGRCEIGLTAEKAVAGILFLVMGFSVVGMSMPVVLVVIFSVFVVTAAELAVVM